MGSEYNKWIILAFLIAISFSVTMEGALAARQLMQLPDLPSFPSFPDVPGFPGLVGNPEYPDVCFFGIECPPPPPGRSTSTAP
ncbi:uncharacterized protein HKW66_Vig0006800 [Vigna angularis]|uniref:Transmembrane protein n=2 Tax=Phaseolus angularis TaxID=3914 RepID=A0A8T0LI27_PHAAN|nr:uncharacterized protein HKW66_Vig0006800 [Vigna angularis]BAT73887.1 hypothetical protein VIGAN_01144100 [Vigna angularis var. angularis]